MKRMIWILLPMVMLSCASRQQNEGDEPKHYELLTIKASDHELTTEYAASLKGQQDIRIIPRIEGYLQGIFVKEGEQVKEGQLLFRVDAATYRAAVEAAVNQMPEVRLLLPNGQFYGQTGRVESISGIVDEMTGAVSVCVLFDNRDGILLSGGTGKIVMPSVRKNAIVIPQEATYEIQDKVYVYKVVDGKTVSTIVQVESQNNGNEYVVISGLKEGDVIVAKGAGFVQEGEEVR